ncbi:hypothetical protein [Leifsonia xyli]|uniref:hypothetical protein n=1 Tax=Leifsonia xyli TaxID=1575 RepID=UPI003D67C597
MPETTTTEAARHRLYRKREAWMQLRSAIAEEYVAKLPELVSIGAFARLTGMTVAQVRHATTTGDLVVSLRDGRRGIAPGDNIPFLLRERLLRLPPPDEARLRRGNRSLAVSHEAYERVWDEAVRSATTPQDALDRLLLAGAATAADRVAAAHRAAADRAVAD